MYLIQMLKMKISKENSSFYFLEKLMFNHKEIAFKNLF